MLIYWIVFMVARSRVSFGYEAVKLLIIRSG